MQTPVQGSYIALPTPFHEGRVDLERFEAMIERLAELGADGILVAGTTGEVPTLNDYEHRSLIHAAVEFNHGRLGLLAGIGTNCTRTSVELARFAASSGVDALMAVTPYYNRPSRRGLLLHYGQLADATDLPLVLYNVPKRTGVDLTPDVAAELAARHESIVAIKETGTSIERVRELVEATDLAVLCGEDRCLFEYCAAGAIGAVSVVGNIVPKRVSTIVHSVRGGVDIDLGRELQRELMPLIEALALDTNPVPLKAALAELGLCGLEVRAPLAPADGETRRALRIALSECPALQPLEAEPVELE
jgi:4-hydroxy-tetrahydrodipicolinate synthase